MVNSRSKRSKLIKIDQFESIWFKSDQFDQIWSFWSTFNKFDLKLIGREAKINWFGRFRPNLTDQIWISNLG